MDAAGFPLIKRTELDTCRRGNILDAAAWKPDGGLQKGFRFCECCVVFHRENHLPDERWRGWKEIQVFSLGVNKESIEV